LAWILAEALVSNNSERLKNGLNLHENGTQGEEGLLPQEAGV
jgi:hypothetical protein